MPADRSFPKQQRARAGVILRSALYRGSYHHFFRSLGRDWASSTVNERLHECDVFGSVNDYAICSALDRAQALANQAQILVRLPGHREGGDHIKASNLAYPGA